MNEIEFNKLVRELKICSHDKMEVKCEECGIAFSMQLFKLRKKFRVYGKILCCNHSIRECWKNEEYKKNISNKVSKKLKGIEKSAETKKKMSEAKLAFWKTSAGLEAKKKLSILTAQGHIENKYENAKRQGWFPSDKNNKLVFFGSSYELRLCWMLENDDLVQDYETQIGYSWEGRGRCLDFLFNYTNGTKKAIEVKPYNRLEETLVVSQINDSSAHAKSKNWNFGIVTEIELGMKCEEIRNWADELKTQFIGTDFISVRKEHNRIKAKKHYDNVKSQDKVQVDCEFCKLIHDVLRMSYDKNMVRNGRYICEKEGGFIAGSKPKKKKVNLYAVDGKKECTQCKEVKSFEDFGSDKSRSDGYSSRCKQCRIKK